MASLRQIKRRMKSVDNIHEITKAMEMIAGFRFKKAEQRFIKAKPYLLEMEELVADLSRCREELAYPLFETREIRKKALVLVTADKGLCGAYNTNLFKSALAWFEENKDYETSLVPLGKKGCEFFKKKQVPYLFSYPEKLAVDLEMAKKIAQELKSLFLTRKVDSVELLYCSYRPGAAGRNLRVPYLSLSRLCENRKGKAPEVDYIYEPDFDTVMNSLLSAYLEGKIYLTLLESITSEHNARMIAMKQATDNGEEVMDDLTLLRNKTRQATITRELSEIVGGAGVLL